MRHETAARAAEGRAHRRSDAAEEESVQAEVSGVTVDFEMMQSWLRLLFLPFVLYREKGIPS